MGAAMAITMKFDVPYQYREHHAWYFPSRIISLTNFNTGNALSRSRLIAGFLSRRDVWETRHKGWITGAL